MACYGLRLGPFENFYLKLCNGWSFVCPQENNEPTDRQIYLQFSANFFILAIPFSNVFCLPGSPPLSSVGPVRFAYPHYGTSLSPSLTLLRLPLSILLLHQSELIIHLILNLNLYLSILCFLDLI